MKKTVKRWSVDESVDADADNDNNNQQTKLSVEIHFLQSFFQLFCAFYFLDTVNFIFFLRNQVCSKDLFPYSLLSYTSCTFSRLNKLSPFLFLIIEFLLKQFLHRNLFNTSGTRIGERARENILFQQHFKPSCCLFKL